MELENSIRSREDTQIELENIHKGPRTQTLVPSMLDTDATSRLVYPESSEGLQKELVGMHAEHRRLSEQMKNDERRLKKHAETLQSQLSKYKKRSEDSKVAIKRLEDRNRDLTSMLHRQNKQPQSLHVSSSSKHVGANQQSPMRFTSQHPMSPTSSCRQRTSNEKDESRLEHLVHVLTLSRITWEEGSQLYTKQQQLIESKGRLMEELRKLGLASTLDDDMTEEVRQELYIVEQDLEFTTERIHDLQIQLLPGSVDIGRSDAEYKAAQRVKLSNGLMKTGCSTGTQKTLLKLCEELISLRFAEKSWDLLLQRTKEQLNEKSAECEKLDASLRYYRNDMTRKQEAASREHEKKVEFLLAQLRESEAKLQANSDMLRSSFNSLRSSIKRPSSSGSNRSRRSSGRREKLRLPSPPRYSSDRKEVQPFDSIPALRIHVNPPNSSPLLRTFNGIRMRTNLPL